MDLLIFCKAGEQTSVAETENGNTKLPQCLSLQQVQKLFCFKVKLFLFRRVLIKNTVTDFIKSYSRILIKFFLSYIYFLIIGS